MSAGFQCLTVLTWPDMLQHSVKTYAHIFAANSILLACIAAMVLRSSMHTRDPLTAQAHVSFAVAVEGALLMQKASHRCVR